MEGVPRVPVLSPELRTPDPLPEQFVDRIKEYILHHYQDDPEKFNNAFTELVSMRMSLNRCVPDVETLCVMKRYYSQLVMMKKRFPMEQNDPIAIPFSWADRTSDMPTSLFFEDVNFELCSIMFNIGAMHAQIAAMESRSDLDSIKNAFMHFQYAAWPLQQLRDQMNAARYGANDFQISILTFYLNVLLAQAQECMLEKSMIDHRKPTVIAKVAVHLGALYQQCHEHLETSDIADHISSSKFKQWSRMCAVKSDLYRSISNFYMAVYAEDEKNFGLRLAYMTVALEQIKKAVKLVEKDKQESLKQSVAFASDVIVQKEANARKENDFIYHERVPKPDDLPKADGVVMVKPIGFDLCDRSISGEDLFAALLPSNVIKVVSMYSEEKAKYKRDIIGKVEQRDAQLTDYLNTLQLHKINFDQTNEHLRLPEELLRSSAAFVAQPDAFPELLDKFDKVAKFSQSAEVKLESLKNRLTTITHKNLTEDDGYKAILAKLEELTTHHIKARTNNTELQRAVATHSGNLKLLGMPLAELAKEVCGDPINISNTEEGVQLRKLLDKVEEMQKQRIRLINEFKSDLENDDITQKALMERDLDGQRLFDAELKKHDKVVSLIELNLSAQDNILHALTEANANFASLRKQIDKANDRQNQQALALVTAFEVYEDVRVKTEKALNFYSQLFSLIGTLDKTIKNMEEIFAKLKADEDTKKKRDEDEIASKMIQASLQDEFPNLPVDLPTPSLSANVQIPATLPENSTPGRQRRPKLGDYMDFYRTKMANSRPPAANTFSPVNMQIPDSLGGGACLTGPISASANQFQIPSNMSVQQSLPQHMQAYASVYQNNPTIQGQSQQITIQNPAINANKAQNPHMSIPTTLVSNPIFPGYATQLPPPQQLQVPIPPTGVVPQSQPQTQAINVSVANLAPMHIQQRNYEQNQQLLTNFQAQIPRNLQSVPVSNGQPIPSGYPQHLMNATHQPQILSQNSTFPQGTVSSPLMSYAPQQNPPVSQTIYAQHIPQQQFVSTNPILMQQQPQNISSHSNMAPLQTSTSTRPSVMQTNMTASITGTPSILPNMPLSPSNIATRLQTSLANSNFNNQLVSPSPWHRNIQTGVYNSPHQPSTPNIPPVQQNRQDTNTPMSPFQPIQPAPAQTAVHFNPIQANSPLQHPPQLPANQVGPSNQANSTPNQHPQPPKNLNLDLLSELFDDQLSAAPVLAPSPMVTKQHNLGSSPPSMEKNSSLSTTNSPVSINPNQQLIPPQGLNQFINEKEQKNEKNFSAMPTSSPRPAATVLPIVQSSALQPNANVYASNSEANMSISACLSISHAGEHVQQANLKSNQATEDSPSSSNKILSLLDHDEFCLGDGNKTKLQKRQLREQFKKFGTTAKLPNLQNENDPLSQLNAKFWFTTQ